ncbi:hypothetical protein B0A55_11983 [Friedmanniomyces simplex]|uniref:Uncharacterized protein n=1 Tax=Friedmanniomyces simplex TaxID=329884 RepID=A0A4U0W2D6_9PEZI|nr:hypothetical protein B0A55_11983 [Friedmanniomyces simplex]
MASTMQRAYSDQTTPLEYNRQLADYYRQQIAALRQGLPQKTPSMASIDDIVKPTLEDPMATASLAQSAQRTASSSTSSSSGASVVVTSRDRTESYESTQSTLIGTPDTTGSSKPASSMGPHTVALAGSRCPKALKHSPDLPVVEPRRIL